jgi:hypothetical protein
MELWLLWVDSGVRPGHRRAGDGHVLPAVIGLGAFAGALVAWIGGNDLCRR